MRKTVLFANNHGFQLLQLYLLLGLNKWQAVVQWLCDKSVEPYLRPLKLKKTNKISLISYYFFFFLSKASRLRMSAIWMDHVSFVKFYHLGGQV